MGAFVSGPAARAFAGLSDRLISADWRGRAARIAAATLLAGGLAACTVVSSVTHLGPETGRRTAFAYMLPKAVVPVQLYESQGNFYINATDPIYLGDPLHQYYATYNASPFSSDTVDVVVDSSGLLKTVNVTADDKTSEVLINLAKSFASVRYFGKESSSLQTATLIATVDIDPDDVVTLRAASDALTAAMRIRINHGIRENCSQAAASDPNKKELCGIYSSLRASRPKAALDAYAPVLPPQTELPDCSIGVCFRLPVPYRLTAGFKFGKDVAISSAVVALPNGGPIVATDFSRTPFVKKVINAGFTDGMLTSLKIEKPSEAVQIAILPANIIAAFFEAITSTFGSRQKALEAEERYIGALNKLEDARKTSRSGKESSTRAGASRSLLQVGMGPTVRAGRADLIGGLEGGEQPPQGGQPPSTGQPPVNNPPGQGGESDLFNQSSPGNPGSGG